MLSTHYFDIRPISSARLSKSNPVRITLVRITRCTDVDFNVGRDIPSLFAYEVPLLALRRGVRGNVTRGVRYRAARAKVTRVYEVSSIRRIYPKWKIPPAAGDFTAVARAPVGPSKVRGTILRPAVITRARGGSARNPLSRLPTTCSIYIYVYARVRARCRIGDSSRRPNSSRMRSLANIARAHRYTYDYIIPQPLRRIGSSSLKPAISEEKRYLIVHNTTVCTTCTSLDSPPFRGVFARAFPRRAPIERAV